MQLLWASIRGILLTTGLTLLSACAERDSGLSLQYAQLLSSPRPVVEFQVTDQHGAAFTREHLLGSWTLVFSGFTRCPDVCPLTLARLREAEVDLVTSHHRVLFVSVDSERDTPALLKEYLGWFNPAWTGLSGPTEEITRLLDSLDMAHVRVPVGSGDDYTVDHTTAVVLLDPQARKVGYWKAPLDSTELAADLAALPAP